MNALSRTLLEQQNDAEQVIEDSAFWQDAEVIGRPTSAYEKLLDTSVTMMTGALYGAKDRRNTQDGKWTEVSMPWANWIIGADKTNKVPEWGFSRHPESKNKEGACLVLGSSIGGSRKAKAMSEMSAVGLDIDSGVTFADAVEKVEALGLFCLAYTTFSHGQCGLKLKRDEVLRKLQITTDPTLDQIKNYLREHDKNRYEPEFIDAITIADPKEQTAEGVVIRLNTPPLDKFRLIFPLAEPVKIVDLADTHEAALKAWEDSVVGLAQNTLGIHFDTACTDPSRLFYTPRHPKKSDDWDSVLIQGDPLNFSDIKPLKKSTYTSNRDVNAFTLAGGGNDGPEIVDVITDSGLNLTSWHKEHKDRFLLADLLENECPDKIRVTGGEAQGQVHCECPFGHEHSSEGGTATMAINALDSQNDYWTMFCKHDACQGRHKTEFLAEMLRQEWFEENLLTDVDRGYLLEADDDAIDATAQNEPDFEPIKKWLPKRYKVEGGQILLKSDGDDKGDTPICQLFDVVGKTMLTTGDGGAGVLVSFTNRSGNRIELAISRAALFNDNKSIIAQFVDADFAVAGRTQKHCERLLDLFEAITPQRTISTALRPGWVEIGESFVTPTGELISKSGDMVRLDDKATVAETEKSGTLQGWCKAASAAQRAGNFYWGLGLASGFAGPLLELLDVPPCGIYLSGATSMGKSIALRCATSIWTTPADKRGLFMPMNTTSNAVEDLAVMGTGSVLALDDVGAMADQSALMSMLFSLSTGSGKSRKRGRGSEGLERSLEYKPFVLLTNERGLRETIEATKKDYKAGISVRFPDVEVTGGKQVDNATIKAMEGIKANYGHAGPAFVRYLLDNLDREAWRARLDDLKSLIAGKDAPAAKRRASEVFAVVALAGELAHDAGLLASDVTEDVRAAYSAFEDGSAGKATEETNLIEQFKAFFVTSNAVIPAEEAADQRNGDIVGWHTPTHIVLIKEALSDPDKLKIRGTQGSFVKALKAVDAVDLQGKNNFHSHLPREVILDGSHKERAVANIRIKRDVIGL